MAYSTSEHAGFIRSSATRLLKNGPVDAGDARDGVINNLNHLEDSAGQCLVNFVGIAGGGKAYWDGLGSSTAYTRVDGLPVMPVLLRALADGTTTRLVIRLNAEITIAGTATFRIALMPHGSYLSSPPPPASVGYTNIAEISTSSTSAADLDPVSVYVSARDGASIWQTLPSRDGSGVLGSVQACLGSLEVWSFSSSAGKPRINAITVQEYLI